MTTEPITFAGSERATARLGVGTWAWGDRSTWGMGGYDHALTEASIAQAWEASLEAGVTLFDTAEVYGGGESERIIGRLLAADPARRSSALIATKFMPSPWKLNVSLRSHAALAEALAAVHADGLVSSVGVSNYSIKEMEDIHGELAKRGVPLGSNQIEFSLLRRRPETTGLLAACQRLGVVPLAYSPIGQGRLTGKYSAANPPPGKRTFSAHPMSEVDPIVAELGRIGGARDGRTPSQVALAWIIAKGAVPIPGAKSAAQARENAGALGWALTADEITALDSVALQGQRTLQQRIWQHG